jgi:hypothetical protein
MSSQQDSQIRRYKWHIAIIVVTVAGALALSVFTNAFEPTDSVRQFVSVVGGLIFLGALLVMLSRVSKIVNTLNENSARLEEASKALEIIREGLTQINHSTRISDTAKAIAFREDDKRSLREAVFERLKQNDFDGAYEIVDEIENHSEYRLLAEELRRQADNYRNATEDRSGHRPGREAVRRRSLGQGQSADRVSDSGPPRIREDQGSAAKTGRKERGTQTDSSGRLG